MRVEIEIGVELEADSSDGIDDVPDVVPAYPSVTTSSFLLRGLTGYIAGSLRWHDRHRAA